MILDFYCHVRHQIAEAHGLIFDAKDKDTWDKYSSKGAVLAKIVMRMPINTATTAEPATTTSEGQSIFDVS